MGRLVREAFVGTSGKVYENGELIGHIESISVKVTGNFEDLELCGSFVDDYAYISCKCEGEMTYVMTDSDRDKEILADFESGNMRERTIVTTLTNQTTGKSANYSISNVVYTETTPVEHGRKVIKKTTPFKCSIPKELAA